MKMIYRVPSPHIISLRQHPEQLERFIDFFVRHWHNEAVYRDCLPACLNSSSALPQWYLLINHADDIIGGAGLITNDFISRMDLWPWLCALYIEEPYRGNAFGLQLIKYVRMEAARLGFAHLYLCTNHVGYYEKYGFEYIGDGAHPWQATSRLYHITSEENQ
jgi:N-acetylglutamate synthase-like GNAT family acetyltransferase